MGVKGVGMEEKVEAFTKIPGLATLNLVLNLFQECFRILPDWTNG